MKIAFFDSGLGGLSVLHHAMHVMPRADFLFYADEDNVPYGEKTPDEILSYVEEAFRFFLAREVDAIVIACNTATSVAAKEMRAAYSIPIIGMEPAVKAALDAAPGDHHRVLVSATPVTVRGEKMKRLLARVDRGHRVDLLALPGLVPLAERGVFAGREAESYLERMLAPYDLSRYSAFVLGCTHFNYFKGLLREMLPENVRFYDGNAGTVRELMKRLRACGKDPLAGDGTGAVSYYYSGRPVKEEKELSRIAEALEELSRVYTVS